MKFFKKVFQQHNEEEALLNKIMVYDNNDKYYGDINDGKRNGKGKYIYNNGDRYEGEWKNNIKNGKGKYYYNTGELYFGDWLDNKRHGHGKFFYQNGDIYVGGWQDNLKHGLGTYCMQNSDKFHGCFEYNKKHGKGYLMNINGDIFEEIWFQGRKKSEKQLYNDEAQQKQSEFSDNGLDDISNDNTIQSIEDIQEIDIDKYLQELQIQQVNKIKKDSDDIDCQQSSQSKLNYQLQYNSALHDDPCLIPDYDLNSTALRNSQQENENDQIRIQTENVESINYPQELQSKEDIFAITNQGNMLNSQLNGHLEPPISESQDDRVNIGFDTLNAIEQYDQISYYESIIDKPIQNWSEEDVEKWLEQINFSELKQLFRENNINGNNLFSLTENDLKNEFGMVKVGPRKDLMKNILTLKDIYSKNKVQAQVLEEKLTKIINLKKFKTKIHSSFSPMKYTSFPSRRRSFGNILSLRQDQKQLQEVIEERDELQVPEATTPTKTSLYLEPNEQEEKTELCVYYSAQQQNNNNEQEQMLQNDDQIIQNQELFFNQNSPNNQNKKKRQGSSQTQKYGGGDEYDFITVDNGIDQMKNQMPIQQNAHVIPQRKKEMRRSNDALSLDEYISNYNNSANNLEGDNLNNQQHSQSQKEIGCGVQNNNQFFQSECNRGDGQQNSLRQKPITDAEYQKNMVQQLENNSSIIDPQAPILQQASSNNALSCTNINNENQTDTSSSSSSSTDSESEQKAQGNTTTPKLKKCITQIQKKSSYNSSSSEEEKNKIEKKNKNNQRKKVFKEKEQVKEVANGDSKDGSPQVKNKAKQRTSQQSIDKGDIDLLKKKRYMSMYKQKNSIQNTETSYKTDINKIMRVMANQGIGLNFLIDFYELEYIDKIGEGGYGEVFKGIWLGKEVAIKQYGKRKQRFHKHRAIDFIKEVEVINNLRHPNIVLYMGVCLYQNQYLMITEFLEQGSLFDQLHKKHTKLTQEKCLAIAEDIALGLCYLHGRKVLHCDLKSSNVLIDNNWTVKLCDFGLSRIKSKINKKQDGRVGTPHWMAPEILRGEQYAEYSDVYSYGMILWEMLTAEIPYFGLSPIQIIGTVGYINKHHLQMPKEGDQELLTIMKECLNRDPQKRPTFKDIVERLQLIKKQQQKPQNSKKTIIKELFHFFGD